MIRPPVRNDKKSRVMDAWMWTCAYLFDEVAHHYPPPCKITGRSAAVKKIFTTYKQPVARMGFRRGQRM